MVRGKAPRIERRKKATLNRVVVWSVMIGKAVRLNRAIDWKSWQSLEVADAGTNHRI
jgi:hypothetical protein